MGIGARMWLITRADKHRSSWQSAATDASAEIARMREACLSDIQIHSDRQPERLRVDDHMSGPPAIWYPATTAWIIVDVGTRDWCNLAYQFGHELGHVVANSWARDAKPGGPCQWLEEALVEAFSFRGLGRLAIPGERGRLFRMTTPMQTPFSNTATARCNPIGSWPRSSGPLPG